MIIDEVFRTSMRKVYTGGDVATGAETVAMGTTKQATHAIDRILREEQKRKGKNTFNFLIKNSFFCKVLGMQKFIISGI